MKRKTDVVFLFITVLVLVLLIPAVTATSHDDSDQSDYEVWIMDQSDTRDENGDGILDSGGKLYIYQGEDLEGDNPSSAPAEVIDFGGAVRDLCMAQSGSAPRRPHMFFFNTARTHAVISFVASGHVLFMESATRIPIKCIDVGVQAHSSVPSHDETYVVVANQNGRLLQRIDTDYSTGSFTLDSAATINLATCTTPNGLPCQDPILRPDTRPICPIIDSCDRFTFVTLAGGGMFVVDANATPMSIVAEYDKATVHPDGCGGKQANGRMFINSGGALEADLYSFPLRGYSSANAPNNPSPVLVYSHDGTNSDSHGMTATRRERFLWIVERFGNNVTVVDSRDQIVVNQFSLTGTVSNDPAPDLIDTSPNGNLVFMSLRGPNPLTGNNPAFNNAVGSAPGLGIIRVQQGGRSGSFFARLPISNIVADVERADPHGMRVLVE